MAFNFSDLDAETRRHMVAAINQAIREGQIYKSARFTEEGKARWTDLLLESAEKHNEHWLAYQLEVQALMKGLEVSRNPSGGYSERHVPYTAAETFAEGQFNRFYILGLSYRAIENEIASLEIYRAKHSAQPRPTSEALIGTTVSPEDLINQLRVVSDSFKSELVKPNSGLSVRISKAV